MRFRRFVPSVKAIRPLLVIWFVAMLAGCSIGSPPPKPTPLGPNEALIGVKQIWKAQVGQVNFPLDVNVIGNTVIPAVGTVLGTALSVADVAHDTRVQAAVKRLQGAKRELTKPAKSGPGFGTYLALALGAAALIGVVYAVWQTFRADDELWVAEDDSPEPPIVE